MEDILRKFNYPASLISQNESWYILLRPEQVTFCSMILISKKSKNSSFSKLNNHEQLEMFESLKLIEEICYNKLESDKINFLAFMMIDPIVHFHIFPRFQNQKSFDDIIFTDPGFPGVVDLNHINLVDQKKYNELVIYLKGLFNEE